MLPTAWSGLSPRTHILIHNTVHQLLRIDADFNGKHVAWLGSNRRQGQMVLNSFLHVPLDVKELEILSIRLGMRKYYLNFPWALQILHVLWTACKVSTVNTQAPPMANLLSRSALLPFSLWSSDCTFIFMILKEVRIYQKFTRFTI